VFIYKKKKKKKKASQTQNQSPRTLISRVWPLGSTLAQLNPISKIWHGSALLRAERSQLADRRSSAKLRADFAQLQRPGGSSRHQRAGLFCTQLPGAPWRSMALPGAAARRPQGDAELRAVVNCAQLLVDAYSSGRSAGLRASARTCVPRGYSSGH
jgi:hypothetical protein